MPCQEESFRASVLDCCLLPRSVLTTLMSKAYSSGHESQNNMAAQRCCASEMFVQLEGGQSGFRRSMMRLQRTCKDNMVLSHSQCPVPWGNGYGLCICQVQPKSPSFFSCLSSLSHNCYGTNPVSLSESDGTPGSFMSRVAAYRAEICTSHFFWNSKWSLVCAEGVTSCCKPPRHEELQIYPVLSPFL